MEGESKASYTQPAFLTVSKYGQDDDGHQVYCYTLLNNKGVEVKILNYGATIISFRTPDRHGTIDDIVLGFQTLDEWLHQKSNFNSVVGRYANRIAKGSFQLDGKSYQLATNNGPNHLHGGPKGFYSKLFDVHLLQLHDGIGVEMTYVSPDGEEGYPGKLNTKVTYVLRNDNSFFMDMIAITDAPTIVNMCNHAYWNLCGTTKTVKDGYINTIHNHTLQLDANKYTPFDDTLITTGELADVAGTPLDFTTPKSLGTSLEKFVDDKITNGGIDHNFVLNKAMKKPYDNFEVNRCERAETHAAKLKDPESGRVMEVWTNQPGIQVYTGNFIDGWNGRGGVKYGKHSAICLETQLWPDSPNKPHFPSPVLRPGQIYRHCATHYFYTEP